MYDSGTVRHGDIIIAGHIMSLFALFCHKFTRARKQRLVSFVLQILSGISFKHLICGRSLTGQTAKHIVKQCLCHVIGIAVRSFYLHISLLRIYTQSHIGRQRPGRSGPRQEIGVFVRTFEPRHCRALLYRLITLRHFVTGKRRSTAGTIGNNLKSLVQKPFIPYGLKRPPLGLNIIIVISNVRMIHIRPKAHGTRKILPHSLILPDTFLTFADKGLQAILLNLFLSIQAKPLLHLQLHRQSVGIPACFPGNHAPLHGAVPWNHILKGAGLHMSDMGLTVCCWRAVVKIVNGSFPAAVNALSENILFPPELLHSLFTFLKARIGRNRFVHFSHPFFAFLRKSKKVPSVKGRNLNPQDIR